MNNSVQSLKPTENKRKGRDRPSRIIEHRGSLGTLPSLVQFWGTGNVWKPLSVALLWGLPLSPSIHRQDTCSTGWGSSFGRAPPSVTLSPQHHLLSRESHTGKKNSKWGRVLTTTESVAPPNGRRVGYPAPESAWAPVRCSGVLRPQECLLDP